MNKVRKVEDEKIEKEIKRKINKDTKQRNLINQLERFSAGVDRLTSTSKTLLKNTSENNFSKTSARPTYSTSNRVLASLLLGALFLNTSQPVKLAKAETLPSDYEFKAPQTINTNPEEVKDFEGYDNNLDYQVIPEARERGKGFASRRNVTEWNDGRGRTLRSADVPTIDTTLPLAISNLMKSYQQRILLAMGNEKDRNNILKNILNKVYPTIQDTIQNAYASAGEPWKSGASNTVVALFNNINYLNLRRQAEDKKRKDKEKAKSKLLDGNKKLKDNLIQALKNIKDKFRRQKLAILKRLENFKKSQEQNVNNLTTKLKSIPNRLIELKRALANKLNSFNFLKNKAEQHRKDAHYYDDKYNRAKRKYRKYKKKYRKKHKSKYKKRYKKYKKKYKKYKRRRKVHEERYRNYEKQKNQAYQEYLNLQKELSSLENNQTVLKQQLALATTELGRTKEDLENETNRMSKAWPLESSDSGAKGQAFSETLNQDYQAEVKQTLTAFEIAKQKLKDDFVNDLQKTEDEYQSNLDKAEIYQAVVNQIKEIARYQVEETIAMGQERVRYEIALRKYIKEETQRQKLLAEERIAKRKNLGEQIAQTVYLGMIKAPRNLLNAFNTKLTQLQKELKKIGKKVKEFKEAYGDNKGYKKKMKKYKKKYEKYAKKVKKYKGKSGKKNKKKYKKYINKRESARKKYEKYLKKYQKYGSLKKVYKSSYKQSKKIYEQFKEQYNSLVGQRNDLQSSYNQSLKQARDFRNNLLKQTQKEYKYSNILLAQAETMEDYSLIGLDNKGGNLNEDLKAYLSLIPATSTYSLGGLASLNFQGGLEALGSIKKSLKKIRHKAKKAYKKALAKMRKQQAEEQRRKEEARKAYWRRVSCERKQAEQRAEKARQDSFLKWQINQFLGFGYNPSLKQDRTKFGDTNIYPTKYSYKNIQPLKMPNGFKLKIEDVLPTYQPTKSWFEKLKDKVKDFGKGILKKIKDVGEGALGIVKATGKIIGEMWNQGTSIITNGIKSLGTDLSTFAVGRLTWYNRKIRDGQIKFDEFKQKQKDRVRGLVGSAVDFAKDIFIGKDLPVVARPYAKFAEDVYGDKNVELPDGSKEITDRNELLKIGLTPEMLMDEKSGFKASVYIDKEGKIIVAFAGTSNWKDWVTNFKQGLGFKTKQYKSAGKIADILKSRIEKGEINNNKLIFVGHSLGGGQAALAGAITGAETYTFNAAGVHRNTLKDVKNINLSRITNYTNYDDALTYFQEDGAVSFLAPDALGKQVDYGSKINSIIPGFTNIGKILELGNGVVQHGSFKIK